MEFLSKDYAGFERASEVIRAGGLVLWPSNGVYGLAGRALDNGVVERMYTIKSRERGKPFAVMTNRGNAESFGRLDDLAKELLDRFWPGFLGLIVPKTEVVPDWVTAGLSSVALVCPNEVSAALAQLVGEPIAATSANISGQAEFVDPNTAAAQFDGLVDAIILGPTMSGTLNTLLDLTARAPTVLRDGGITREQLRASGVSV